MTATEISNYDAIKACLNQSLRVDDREIIHVFLGCIGCDWDLLDVIGLIRESSMVWWGLTSISTKECLLINFDDKIYILDQVLREDG